MAQCKMVGFLIYYKLNDLINSATWRMENGWVGEMQVIINENSKY